MPPDAFTGHLPSQPAYPSPGCMFSNTPNPHNHPAGRMLDICGLKGMRIGQVMVAEEHANFIVNLGGGQSNALSLAELSRWCSDRLGVHQVGSDPNDRPYDVPWLIMDSALAKEEWGWQPQTPIEAILEEIAEHAEQNPNWLKISGLS